MDEPGWLRCEEVQSMINHLCVTANVHRKKAGRRKLRLLTCACAREVWDLMSEPCRAVIDCVERVVEDRASEEELARLQQAMREQAGVPGRERGPDRLARPDNAASSIGCPPALAPCSR